MRWILQRLARRFGRRYDYDVDYLLRVIEVSPAAAVKVSLAQGMTHHRRGIALAPYFAAKVRTALAEDCGPCAQLVVNMALEAGVPPDLVRSVVAGEVAALPPEVALVVQFTDRVLVRDPAAEPLREQIRQRWGEPALVTLALAISASRLYPTLKYALGFGLACQRVSVAEETLAPGGTGARAVGA